MVDTGPSPVECGASVKPTGPPTASATRAERPYRESSISEMIEPENFVKHFTIISARRSNG